MPQKGICRMKTPFYIEPVALHVLINAFFLYSFLGWIMECCVIRHEKGIWENRGFAHLPFCVIYGFGAMIGYAVLAPISHNYVLLYIVGALAATALEYVTARIMLRLFGTFWWDYTNKRFNYKGILCLESTLAWGFVALFVFTFLHRAVFSIVMRLPERIGSALAFLLACAYGADFLLCVHKARRAHAEPVAQEVETVSSQV